MIHSHDDPRPKRSSPALGIAAICVPLVTVVSVCIAVAATAFLVDPTVSLLLSLALFPVALLICAACALVSIVLWCNPGRGRSVTLFRIGAAVGLSCFLLLVLTGFVWYGVLEAAILSQG